MACGRLGHPMGQGMASTRSSTFPLAGAPRARCCAIDFPVERQPALLDLMDPVLADAAEYFIGCDVSPCVFEMYWRLRGMEKR